MDYLLDAARRATGMFRLPKLSLPKRSRSAPTATSAPNRSIEPAAAPPDDRVAPVGTPGVSHYLPSEDWEELLVTDGDGLPTLYLQMHTGELRLTEPTTGKLVAVGNHHLRRMGIWTVDLSGVDARKTAVREGLLQPGSPVSLVREPDNAHDGNAIAVHAAAGRPVGYLNRRTAAGLSRLLDTGMRLEAISIAFDSVTAGRPGGVKVLAASPELVRHLLRKRPGAGLIAPLDLAS
ncbi:HIRAN domain-containing protein [Cryobacterium sp. Sr8]|uniref:HIRAN domain-containing protein n=1 Tax=Cryobacterium sp. Sr8 TaxID=1259203 RepID=UPI0018E06840|nr:HIRAN domain-containing protein [Cryobacterium sp. Sr8]